MEDRIKKIEEKLKKQDEFNKFTFKMLMQMFQSILSTIELIAETQSENLTQEERDELNQAKGILKTLGMLFKEFEKKGD